MISLEAEVLSDVTDIELCVFDRNSLNAVGDLNISVYRAPTE